MDVYANDRNNPTMVFTYTTKEETRELEMFKIWLREDLAQDFEYINYANIVHRALSFQNKPTEYDVTRIYQTLFASKLWEVPKRTRTVVNSKATLKVAPYRGFKEIDKDYFKRFVDLETTKYMKRLKGELN